MTSSDEASLRERIVEVCKRIHARGWLASTDGNVSVRLDDDRILATPTAIHKGFMSADDVIVVDRQGRKLQGTRQPSSELRMHLAAYEERPDVRAVVHAHPTFCIVLSLAGVSLAKCLLPETVLTFGSIPTTAYSTPTTEEVPDEIRKWVRTFDAMVLDRHGSLTVGTDLYDAYNKLERMEHVAEITYRARMLGPLQPLSCDQVTHLQNVARGLGLPERKLLDSPCETCTVCKTDAPAQRKPALAPQTPVVAASVLSAPSDELIQRVTKAMQRALEPGGDRSR